MMITVIGRLLHWMVICGLLLVHSDCAPLNHSPYSNNNSHVPSYLDAFKELIAQHVYGASADNNSSDSIKNDDLFDLNSSGEFLRDRRNAPTPDKLKELVDKSSILARISNGIALQSGLMDGSIKIEDAVGELLNFGTLKVSEVNGFKVDSIKELAGKLKQLPTSLDKSTEELENTALAWNELRKKSEAVKAVTDLPQKEAYFTALGNYEKSFNFDVFTTAHDALKEIFEKLGKIESLKVDDKSPPRTLGNAFGSHFQPLPSLITTAIDELEKVKKTADSFTANKILVDSYSIFGPFGIMLELITFRSKLKGLGDDSNHEVIKNNFGQLDSMTSIPIGSEIKELSSLVYSRTNPSSNKRISTSGFNNGVSDLKQLAKEVRDSWIEKFTNNEVSSSRLADGIQSLLNVKDHLLDIDAKLKPVSTNNNQRSISYLEEVLQEVSKTPKKSADLSTILAKINDCRTNGNALGPSDYAPTQKIIQKILKVGTVFSGLEAAVKRINIDQHQKDMDAFIKFLGFKDIGDGKNSPAEVPAVMNRIKTTDKLKKFKELIVGIKKEFTINKTALKADIEELIKQKKIINLAGFDKEGELHVCLQNLKDQFENLEKAIGVTRKLRGIDSARIQNVENLASTVASVKNELTSLGSIPDTMKKDAKEITTEINKWPESLKSSGEIGQSVALLSQANDFKTLVSSGLDDASVQTQIKAIKNGNDRKRIETLWGDQKKFLSDLQASSKEINTIGSNLKLAEIKTFEDYGTVMKTSLEAMKDVKIDVKGKIEALDALISLTKTPAKMEKIKKTLQHLESLDLAFSSHSSHFQKVPNALKSLYDFLVTFSIEPTQAPPPRSGNGPPTQILLNGGAPQNDTVGAQNEKKKEDYLILSIVIPLLVVLISIPIAIYLLYRFKMLCFKPKGNVCPVDFMDKDETNLRPMTQDLIVVMVCQQVYMTHAEFFGFWMKLLVLVKTEKRNENRPRPYRKLHKLKYFDITIMLNPYTALETVRLHGNLLRTWRGNIFIAMQSPMEQSDIHMDTRPEFYALIIQDEVEFVVMLGSTPSSGSYCCEGVGEKMTIDCYEVETVSVQQFPDGPQDVIFRRIKITLMKDGVKLASRTFTQYQYVTWTEDYLPPNFEISYQLMQTVTDSTKPIVVHCPTGTDRTMTFIGLEYISRSMEVHEGMKFEDGFKKLIEKRFNSFTSAQNIGWLQTGVLYFSSKYHGIDMWMYGRVNGIFWEMVRDGTGVPQMVHGTRWT